MSPEVGEEASVEDAVNEPLGEDIGLPTQTCRYMRDTQLDKEERYNGQRGKSRFHRRQTRPGWTE